MGALNIPAASELERLEQRLRSLSNRLESVEDRLDDLSDEVAVLRRRVASHEAGPSASNEHLSAPGRGQS
jgi:chromosome segregation ATPase